MKKRLIFLFNNELFSYIFFGGATTLVSILTRLGIYQLTQQELFATTLANIVGILFAFITNDTIVFKQERKDWHLRLIKFTTSRISTVLLDLLLAYIFVTKFPQIIGQFVYNNINNVNTIETFISQSLIIIINYILSKVYIFNK